MSTKLIWKREVGRQFTECGRYAVQSDGWAPVSQAERDGAGVSAGVTGGEWAAIDMAHPNDNMDWFPTMREAKAECQRHADRAAR